MITKSELHALHAQWTEERRRQVGPPPNDEELFAYFEGRLHGGDEERVRELLIAYPELANAMTLPFPEEDAAPSELGYVSEADVSKNLAAFRKRVRTPDAWRRASLALAAALMIAISGAIWQTVRLARELSTPRVASDEQVLVPDGQRGGENVHATLTAHGAWFVLVTPLINPPVFPAYRVDIVDLRTQTIRWSSPLLQRPPDDTFNLLVPGRFFEPGDYQIVAYGVSGARQERLTTYSIRVPDAGH